jgi:hypothetical protein
MTFSGGKNLLGKSDSGKSKGVIAGIVASLTESELDVLR